MKTDRKLLVPLAILAVVLSGGAVYAFSALSVTTTINVKEPLSINAAVASGDLALDSVTCTTSTDLLSATCSGSVFAGDTGAIDITVANSGHQALTVTPTEASTSSDVAVTSPSAASVAAGGTSLFAFSISVSASAAPSSVTVSMTFTR